MIFKHEQTLIVVSNLKFIIERLRIMSRIFMVGYMLVLYQALQWVYGLPDLSGAQSAIITTLTSVAAVMTKFYVDTGKNLYDDYEDIVYAHVIVEYIDKLGYIIDKFRIFPILFVLFYLVCWYDVFTWAMSLETLSDARATFVSIYSGMASVVFGLLISSGDISINLEKNFLSRYEHNKNKQKDEVENEKVIEK